MWVQEIKVSCFLAFAKSTGVGQGGFEFAVQLAGIFDESLFWVGFKLLHSQSLTLMKS